MRKIIQLFFTLLMIHLAMSLETLEEFNKERTVDNEMLLKKMVQYIIKTKLNNKNRRALNPLSLAKARDLYKALTKGAGGQSNKKDLTSEFDDKKAIRTYEETNLVEKELKLALTHKKSALLDKPYVENHGKNDYLVLRPEIIDPFVTVVPNQMYYNAEKSCVNWLDDCSVRGIRARLLRGVNSP